MEAAAGGSGGGGDDHLHGLKFGKKIYFEDAGGSGSASGSSGSGGSASASDAPPPPQQQQQQQPPPSSASPGRAAGGRRGRGAAGGASGSPAPARCQVEGCNVDLTGAKTYHCRHKVCAMHAKAPLVVVNGIEQRFCQQCSRSRSPFAPAAFFSHSWQFVAFAAVLSVFLNSFSSLGFLETTP
jgi:hypothetical protein